MSSGYFRAGNRRGVAYGRLGCIKSGVGLVKKFFHRLAAPLLAQQEPEAHGYGDRTVGRWHRLVCDGLANLFGAGKCEGRIAIVQDHQEFLATEAANEIIGSYGSQPPPLPFLQDIVPSKVA